MNGQQFARNKLMVTLPSSVVAIDLTLIPPGEFLMGSLDRDKEGVRDEMPARHVRISEAFYLGRFETTQGQYRAVMGQRPGAPEDVSLPVSQITYSNSLEFCRRLSAMAGVSVRLPTEAQWEYACRAGNQCANADLARVAWHSEDRPHPVGQKEPNGFGLYDMLGNVWEYCADFIDDYATMTNIDPIGRVNPRYGAMRGGGWMNSPADCRCARRLISDDMFGGAGFRIALDSNTRLG